MAFYRNTDNKVVKFTTNGNLFKMPDKQHINSKNNPQSSTSTSKASDQFELDRRWHLARDNREITVAEYEYALMRSYEAFVRWQSECLAAITGLAVNGTDNAILHVIRMNDRAKGVKEIGRLTNRDDISNIQYSIKKLLKAGLIRKIGSDNRRLGVSYQVTETGYDVTEKFADLRGKLLIELVDEVKGVDENLESATRMAELMTGVYEQAALIAATYRQKHDD